MSKFHRVLCVASLLVGLSCFASDSELYVNLNYCFSVPRVPLGAETPSQDGTGITFSKEKSCAEAANGSCEKISVYAQYMVDNEGSRKNWPQDLISVYVRAGWHVDARSVRQTSGFKWYVSTLSKGDARKSFSAVTYQTLYAESNPPVIYAMSAIFPIEDKSSMYSYIDNLAGHFSRTAICK